MRSNQLNYNLELKHSRKCLDGSTSVKSPLEENKKKLTRRERVDENESGLIKGKADTLVVSEVQKEKKNKE